MLNIFHSLPFRLVVGFVAVLAIALTSVSLYVGSVAARETNRFEEDLAGARARRIVDLVDGSGEGRDSEEVRFRVQQAAELFGWEILLTDAPNVALGDVTRQSQDRPGDVRLRPNRGAPNDAVLAVDQDGGYVFVRPGHRPTQFATVGVSAIPVDSDFTAGDVDFLRDPPPDRIVESVNRTLMWSGSVAAAVGALLIILMSRGVLRPVRVLSGAARQLGTGDLSQRVPEPGRDEIGRLSDTFNAMATGLEQAETNRRNMVADISHELRTPLSNMQGYVEAMQEGVLAPDPEVLGRLHGLVGQLTRLVEDLRVLALAEAGALPLTLQPVALNAMVRTAVEAFEPRAAAAGIAISLDLAGDSQVVADRDRITQVLGNLLDNAVTHTPDGGTVVVAIRPAGGQPASGQAASVSVSDSGRGMTPEDLGRVFERFYRADPSRTRETGGSGLGLTISRHIIEAHDGAIRASSEPGKGSTFTFELPLA
jgi:signal transduction histidine kinase